ncbi:MAG: 5-oxoprolinase/urea amidolyase family protein [Solirubrobacterales bacterium]|nr:5-oxoprolinase/urea amidolyase family protein [Solirubrobacterales bacterium]
MAAAATTRIEVLEGGIETTVQDYPGRTGMLRQGLFPAGPMDHFAFRAANLLVGNPLGTAALESTLGGLGLRFAGAAVIAVCGAEAETTLDGEPVPLWESRAVKAGSEFRIGISAGPGFRQYVAVSGGIDVPPFFGSRSTYTMGGLGGLDGRSLQPGDSLPLGSEGDGGAAGRRLVQEARPAYAREWQIETVRGPQASPDYLTEADMKTFFSRSWSVDKNSNRTGIRLEPHKFEWARKGGGISGGHPSNILDNSYPVGAININGDLPVILGPDGPTAGGFVVAGTIAHVGFWKLGQLRPVGDTIRFRELNVEEAVQQDREMDERLTAASLEDA